MRTVDLKGDAVRKEAAEHQGSMAEAYYTSFCFRTLKHNSSHHNYLFQELYFKNRAETSVYTGQKSQPEDVYL